MFGEAVILDDADAFSGELLSPSPANRGCNMMFCRGGLGCLAEPSYCLYGLIRGESHS